MVLRWREERRGLVGSVPTFVPGTSNHPKLSVFVAASSPSNLPLTLQRRNNISISIIPRPRHERNPKTAKHRNTQHILLPAMKPVVSAFNAWSWYVSPSHSPAAKIRKQLSDSSNARSPRHRPGRLAHNLIANTSSYQFIASSSRCLRLSFSAPWLASTAAAMRSLLAATTTLRPRTARLLPARSSPPS